MLNKEWKNNDQEVARVNIDDSSIVVEVSEEVRSRFGIDILELQKLNMFPPLDETKMEGEKMENGWTRYIFKKGENWERAKKEVIRTFDFWLGGEVPVQVIL